MGKACSARGKVGKKGRKNQWEGLGLHHSTIIMSSAPLQGFITPAVIFPWSFLPFSFRSFPKAALGLKTSEQGHSRLCDIPLGLPIHCMCSQRNLGNGAAGPFLFSFSPFALWEMSLEAFLSLTSFLQSCFHPFPSFLWRKTWKARPKPLGTGRFRDQNPSFHHLFYLS